MQILQWLFKAPQEQETASGHIKDVVFDKESKSNSKDIIVHVHRRESGKTRKGEPSSWKFKPFAILCRKDVAKTCFYSTINLSRIGSFDKKRHWKVQRSRMKKEDIARGLGIKTQKAMEPSGPHVRNKVLPITDSNSASTSTSSSSSCNVPEKKDEGKAHKGEKTKAVSRMKEILRWAAATKTDKRGKFLGRRVLHFRNRSVTLKAVPDDDQLSNDSPKISFRWDVESCSTASSAYSAISMASSSRIDQIGCLLEPAPKKGNWITTDAEFVVLEL